MSTIAENAATYPGNVYEHTDDPNIDVIATIAPDGRHIPWLQIHKGQAEGSVAGISFPGVNLPGLVDSEAKSDGSEQRVTILGGY